jgi:hypothetical protein
MRIIIFILFAYIATGQEVRHLRIPVQDIVRLDFTQTIQHGPFMYGLHQRDLCDVTFDPDGLHGYVSYTITETGSWKYLTEQGYDSIEIVSPIGRPTFYDQSLTEISEDAVKERINGYPEFQAVTYTAGTYFRHDGKLYIVVQDHTALPHYVPAYIHSLYTRVFPPELVAPWVQPVGGHDAYAIGARVSHAGSIWTSDINANVWEPGVYGWTKQN